MPQVKIEEIYKRLKSQTFIDALIKYDNSALIDFSTFKKLESKTQEIIGLFMVRRIKFSGCLICYEPHKLKRAKKYVSFLRNYLKQFNAKVNIYFEKTNAESELIGSAYASVLKLLDNCDASKLSPSQKQWSLLRRVESQLKDLAIAIEEMTAETHKLGYFDMEKLTVTIEGNEVNPDAWTEHLMRTLNLSLKMISYSSKELSDMCLNDPDKTSQQISEKMNFQVGSYELAGLKWHRLDNCSLLYRFFDGNIKIVSVPEEKGEFLILDGGQQETIYATVSYRRMQNRLRDHYFENFEVFTENSCADVNTEIEILSQIFGYPVRECNNLYGGATITEWVKAYCVFKKLGDSRKSYLAYIKEKILVKNMVEEGVLPKAAKSIIKYVVFAQSSRDLYDAPFIRTKTDKLYFFPSMLSSFMVSKIVLSQINQLQAQFSEKGKRFEKDVVSLLNKINGADVRSFGYKIDDVHYDCDVALLWGGILFLIECKHFVSPSQSPYEIRDFSSSMKKASNQISRIKDQLTTNRDILNNQFGREIQFSEVIPVVLNSFPWWSHKDDNNVYYYDFSALCRLVQHGDITVNAKAKKNVSEEQKYVISKLWKGDIIEPSDLINQLNKCIQFEIYNKQIEIKRLAVKEPETENQIQGWIFETFEINSSFEKTKDALLNP